MGIGIAFRKKALESLGGFNESLQVFEYLDLSVRSKGLKGIKTPELTVLHLEPEERFSFDGFLRRRAEYGFWYRLLFYLHPSHSSIYASPVKLLLSFSLVALAVVFSNPIFLLALAVIYLVWVILHYQLADPNSPIRFASSKFGPWYRKVLAFVLAITIFTLGELAGDIGKLQGMFGKGRLSGPKQQPQSNQ